MSFSIVNSSLGGIPRKRNRFLRCPNGRIVFRCRKDNNQSIPSATRNNSRIGVRIFRAEHQAKKKSRTEGTDLHAAKKFCLFMLQTIFILHRALPVTSEISSASGSDSLEPINICPIFTHLMRKRQARLHQGVGGIDLPGLLLTVKSVL